MEIFRSAIRRVSSRLKSWLDLKRVSLGEPAMAPPALPLKLDFGTGTSPVAAGWARHTTAAYTSARGYGWAPGAVNLSAFDTGFGDPLTRDCVRGTSGTFVIDLPAGSYELDLHTIDPRQKNDVAKVTVNGGGPLDVSPPQAAAVMKTVPFTFAAAGQAQIAFTATGPTATDYFGLAALELRSTGIPPPPPPPPALVVDAGADIQSAEHTVMFTPAISGGTPPYTKSWDYGDGGTGSSDSRTYATTGTYTATLTVTDAGDPSQTVSDSVWVTVEHVHEPPPPGGTIDPDAATIVLHHDSFPNFARNPTNLTTKAGNWSDLSVWSAGRVPTTADVVRALHAVTVDTTAAVCKAAGTVGAAGKLVFPPDRDSRLTLQYLIAFPGSGGVEAGTDAAPVQGGKAAVLEFADRPFDAADPLRWGNGALFLGPWKARGASKTARARLQTAVSAGATTVPLAAAVTGWRPGDRIALDGGPLAWTSPLQGAEVVTLQAVSPDGKTLTLATPLQDDHVGWEGKLPHASNLTRSVVVKSQNPQGVRGHVAYTHHAPIDIRDVAFEDLGRSTVADRWEPGKAGRYPSHLHHHADGTLVFQRNCVAYNTTPDPVWHSGFVIHGTSGATLEDCVAWNFGGSGFVIEDIHCHGNVLRRCHAARIRGPGGSYDWGNQGDGFSVWSADNTIEDCSAANCDLCGIEFFGSREAIRVFRNFEIYHCTDGWKPWELDGGTVRDLLGWQIVKGLCWLGYPCQNLTIDGYTDLGAAPGTGDLGEVGISWGDYDTKNFVWRRLRIKHRHRGLEIPVKANTRGSFLAGTILIEDAVFEDCVLAVVRTIPSGPGNGGAGSCFPRDVTLRNVRYVNCGVWVYQAPIDETLYNSNLLNRDRLFVEAHNGVAGDNFRVWYHEQRSSYVLPDGGPSESYGTPPAEVGNGRTNAWLAANYQWRLSLEPNEVQYWMAGTAKPASNQPVVYPGITDAEGWAPVCLAGEVAPADATDGAAKMVVGLVK